MLTVKFTGAQYPVARAALTLAAGAGPVVRLQFPVNRQPGDDAQASFAASLARGVLSTSPKPLTFLTLGFDQVTESSSRLQTKLEAVGLALPQDLVDWFEASPPPGSDRTTLVYQRASKENGWLFLRRALGRRFANPSDPAAFDSLFPPQSCLWRSSEWDNYEFLTRAIEAVRYRLPTVYGWFARCHAKEPFVLIQSDPSEAPSLGDRWSAADTWLPHRLAGVTAGACARHVEFDAADAVAFLYSLATTADAKAACKAGAVNIAFSNVIGAPGLVADGSRVLFCRSVTYTITDFTTGHIKAEAEFTAPPEILTAGQGSRLLVGGFAAWATGEADGTPRTLVGISSSDRNWVRMDEQGETVDEAAPLLAHSLTPKAYAADHAGFYAKHKDADPMEFIVEFGAVPRVLGAAQTYHEPFEKADLTLNGATVALSASPKATSLEKADALRLAGESRVASIYMGDGAGFVRIDGGAGKITADGKSAVALYSGEKAAADGNKPNHLLIDGQAGMVRTDAKTSLVLNISSKPKVEVEVQKVDMMKTMTIERKKVEVKGTLDVD